jgi:hypothetical protein
VTRRALAAGLTACATITGATFTVRVTAAAQAFRPASPITIHSPMATTMKRTAARLVSPTAVFARSVVLDVFVELIMGRFLAAEAETSSDRFAAAQSARVASDAVGPANRAL